MVLSDFLTAKNLGSSNSFNWTWFIELCVCGILVLFFLFYFNRLFATIVSYFLRLYTWRQFRVWIDIQALQISLLGGRVFFKGLRYHGENETILIHSGHITWRYWLRTVRQVELDQVGDSAQDDQIHLDKERSAKSDLGSSGSDEEFGAMKRTNNAQARIAVFVSGVEWFLYNRTPMYDAILKESIRVDQHPSTGDVNPILQESIKSIDKVKIPSILRRRPVSSVASSSFLTTHETTRTEKDVFSHYRGQADCELFDDQEESDVTLVQSLLIRALPVHIECNRAAVSMGNENTRALLVTTVDSAKGHIDASGCGQYDLFRQLFDFEVEHPLVQMRPNPDYSSSQSVSAERILTTDRKPKKIRPWWKFHFHIKERIKSLLSGLHAHVPWTHSSADSLRHGRMREYTQRRASAFHENSNEQKHWHGLGRYLDENEDDEHQAWSDVEYARFSTILDCPAVHLLFYWDVPGRVKAHHIRGSSDSAVAGINGVKAPAYGLDLTIKGGNVNYGPWADRLRAELQAVFLPATYKSAIPACSLSPGDWRQSTKMLIRVDIEKEVTLRVPTRERSKDWLWRGRSTAVRDAAALRKQRERRHFLFRKGQKSVLGPDIRPFGWLSFSVAADSSIRYEMDLVASSHGYRNKLDLDLKETRASSSVNHTLLWKCAVQRLSCDLSNPLNWNDPHEWHFDIANHSMDFYLLRDHMFLLTDLISDFTAGLKSDYMTFVPFVYKLRLKFNHLQLYLNANDFNIIDNPCDMDGNSFLILGMRELDGQVIISMHDFSPAQSSVRFSAHGNDTYLNLKTPLWNTFQNFSEHEIMATLDELDLDGSYNYCTASSPALTDSLVMNITGTRPKFHLQGFLIRYFMNVKENYFGDYLHYRTLEEFQASTAPNQPQSMDRMKQQVKKDNELDVVLSVRAIESCALMPANTYDRSENLRVDVMDIEADMRFTNYYMDLQVNSSPVESSIEISKDDSKDSIETSNCQLFIDAVSVYGHRLFGAPPAELTYVCNWDFDIGSIFGECTYEFLRIMALAIQSFIFTMDDEQNALKPTEVSLLHDVTFLRARTAGVRLWAVDEEAAFLVELAPFDLVFDDWAGELFSRKMEVSIPKVVIAGVEIEKARRGIDRTGQSVPTFAYIETSVSVALLAKHADFERQRELQQRHVQFHDLRTLRAQHLLHPDRPTHHNAEEIAWSEEPPNIPVPSLPYPIIPEKKSNLLRTQNYDGKNEHVESHETSSIRSSPGSRKECEDAGLAHNQWGVGSQSNLPCQSNKLPSDGSMRHVSTGPDAIGTSFQSAWLPPHFSLHNVRPCSKDLPSIPANINERVTDSRALDTAENLPQTGPSIAHQSLIIKNPTGIRGFCTSSLSKPVTRLIGCFLPQTPKDMLDSVERDTISNILQLDFEHVGKVSDLAVHIPSASFRLINHSSESSSDYVFRDRYDIHLVKSQLMLRTAPTATKHTQSHTKKDVLLTQVSIQHIIMDVSEQINADAATAAGIGITIEDVACWLSLQDKVRTDTRLGSFLTSTSGSTVNRLSLLFKRSSVMIEKISNDFKAINNDYVRQIICHLADLKNDTSDSAFLSRPSYILRSAENHVRMSNAWRGLVILRHRLIGLSSDQNDGLGHSNSKVKSSSDPKTAFLDSLEASATGLVNYESYRPLLMAVFGEPKSGTTKVTRVVDVQANILIVRAAVVLDPGPSQSELSIDQCDLSISQSPILNMPAKREQEVDLQRSKLTVQGWIANCCADLSWELVEFANSMLGLFQKNHSPQRTAPKNPVPNEDPATLASLDLLVIVGTDKALLRMTTLNLEIAFRAESLKSSIAIREEGNALFPTSVIAATSAQLQVSGNKKRLLRAKVLSPNVFAARHHEDGHASPEETIKIAASCEKLRFDLTEGPLGLLEVAHSVLKDEIPVLRSVVSRIPSTDVQVPTDSQTTPFRLPQIHLALFLKDYRLRFAVLPTVTYAIMGKISRTSIVPVEHSRLAIHVDVKRNSHMLMHPSVSSKHATIVLDVPPISGRIMLVLSKSGVRVGAHSAIEPITIEASAVHACLEALYHPVNSEYIKHTQANLDSLQRMMEKGATFARLKEKTEMVRRNDNPISYKGKIVFAGFLIHCAAPVHKDHQYEADLRLSIRCVTFNFHNYDQDHIVRSDTLQFELNAPNIAISLRRTTKFEQRSVASFSTGLKFVGRIEIGDDNTRTPVYHAFSSGLKLDLSMDSPSVAMELVTYLQDRIKAISTASDKSNLKSLRHLAIAHKDKHNTEAGVDARDFGDGHPVESTSVLLESILILEVNSIRARWIVDEATPISPNGTIEDLVFSIRKIDLRTQRESSARLAILDLQLQLVPKGQEDMTARTRNSALLPEVVFKAAHLSSAGSRRFAFQAAGKALDLRLAADGIFPVATIQKSLAKATSEFRTSQWTRADPTSPAQPASVSNILGNKRLASLLIDADFAGAVFSISSRAEGAHHSPFGVLKGPGRSRAGRLGRAAPTTTVEEAVLRAPGVALKAEYQDSQTSDPSFSMEVKIAASNNTLAPTVVPLILDITSSIKEVVGDNGSDATMNTDIRGPAQRYLSDAANHESDPTAVLGKVKLNASLWVGRQEFSLTCQPIARVQATASFDDIFMTINTVQHEEQDRFFSALIKFDNLQASVQHIYSRESTANFEVDSIVMSLMNSKHVSTKNGISWILTISPMRSHVNARQLQDFLLFREIWYPKELRRTSKPATPGPSMSNSQTSAMQKYQEFTATAALPWHAVVSIQELVLQVDFGQALGKSSFTISRLWASSKKNSDWEQNLCIGFDRIAIDSTGRMSGFVELQQFRARTSIKWPMSDALKRCAPLVQASVGFDHLRLKVAFDYQPFIVADVSSFEFLMYNVRPENDWENDRLVGILDGDKIQVFVTSAAGAQIVSIIQAFERLFQEKKEAYQDSLHEVERLLRRKSVFPPGSRLNASTELEPVTAARSTRTNHVLHTDVVVTLKAIDIGAFPSTFFDNQILKIDAANAQARFAVATVDGKVRSGLGMSLGQVKVALSAVGRSNTKALGEVEISDVINRATASRGGTILKVPRLVASMQTWQQEESHVIEYIFRSVFQGKVDVGWNYSRISFIRGMWETHSQALAQRLGKPLPPAAVKITTDDAAEGSGKEKITAVVNMPQTSRYEYVALEPPVIDTPQLRDMGEATPPLEWIGLHRDKLPHVTHSIVIVTLLEVAREVEDAYTRILGAS